MLYLSLVILLLLIITLKLTLNFKKEKFLEIEAEKCILKNVL